MADTDSSVIPPAVGSAHRPCKELKKDGSTCGAKAIAGKDYCMGHRPRPKKITRADVRAQGPYAALHENEIQAFNDIVTGLSVELKAKGIVDSILIDRLAMSQIRARRLDNRAKHGDDKSIRALYFADLTIINIVKTLGADRRLRKQKDDTDDKKSKGNKRLAFLSGGHKGPARTGKIPLERGDNDDDADPPKQEPESPLKGADPESTGGLYGGDSGEGASPEAEDIPPE